MEIRGGWGRWEEEEGRMLQEENQYKMRRIGMSMEEMENGEKLWGNG